MNYRRIDLLKRQAETMSLSTEQVKQFGKLSATQTWEKAIAFYTSVDEKNRWIEPVETTSHLITRSSGSFIEWIGLPQIFCVFLAVALFVVGSRLTPNPLSLFPIRITIQLGAK